MSNQSSTENAQFTWVEFYKELADKLLEYKNRRGELLEILIKSLNKGWISHLWEKETDDWKISELDPFSVFAIFNRNKINNVTRKEITQRLKELFQLESEIPLDFSGIPTAHHAHVIIFDYKKANIADISVLWELFESAINYPNDSFSSLFNKALQVKGIALRNITIALFWVRPDKFITLDSHTQNFLVDNGIQISPNMTGEQYIKLLDTIQHNTHFSGKSFPEISRDAFLSNPSVDEDNDDEDNEDDQEPDSFIKAACDILRIKKNIILQGAPGTGKTYSTAEIALRILGDDVDFSNHKAVMERYEKYRKENRRLFFTTFHQSMDYEDFVEGLKPEVVKDNESNAIGIVYDIKDGIFKDVCKSAIIANNSDNDAVISGLNNNSTIWKINLDRLCGDSIRIDCLNNNYICLPKAGICEDTSKYKSFLRYIQDDMEVGDIVFLSHSSHVIDAIGVVTGKYEYRENNKEFPYSRGVRWIVKDICENIVSINQGKRIAYEWFHTFPSISITHALDIINKYIPRNKNKNIDEKASVVLIIDEINRGNVSKIFGELVTLLEKDKRDDGDHPITVTLPYSKEEFSVPSNVYIIGTMNTTDRSTGTIDYAIRRRFAFVTLKANKEVIDNPTGQKLFDNIQAFINNKTRKDIDIDDLMVGHSYFMRDKNSPLSPEDQLKLKIEYEVAPLLKEYLNDGLLTCSQEELNDHIKAWIKLETYKKDSNTTTNTATSESETSQSNE